MCEKIDRSKQMTCFFALKFNLIPLKNEKWHKEFKEKKRKDCIELHTKEEKEEKNTIRNEERKKEIGWNEKNEQEWNHAGVVNQSQNNGHKLYWLELMKNEKRSVISIFLFAETSLHTALLKVLLHLLSM